MPVIRAVSVLLLAASVAACATAERSSTQPAEVADTITVKGALAYRERIALPPESQARVTILDTSIADKKAPVIVDKTIELGNRQVPIAFQLDVARDQLKPRRRYTLRGTIKGPGGQLLWTTDTAYPVDRDTAVNDLGTLRLVQVRAEGSSGSGVDLPYEAGGNEPGWSLAIDDDRIKLDWAYGEKHARTPRPDPARSNNGTRYSAATEAHELSVQITDGICRDSMTGMPHPDRVVVTIDGTELTGCGGAPRSLLTGSEWVVEDIAGGGIIDASRVTLNFGADGRLSGRASCNSYRTDYDITGEGIEVGNIAATLMACAPALNNQEDAFLEVLRDASRFDIDGTGKLIIHADSGKTLEAYPAG